MTPAQPHTTPKEDAMTTPPTAQQEQLEARQQDCEGGAWGLWYELILPGNASHGTWVPLFPPCLLKADAVRLAKSWNEATVLAARVDELTLERDRLKDALLEIIEMNDPIYIRIAARAALAGGGAAK